MEKSNKKKYYYNKNGTRYYPRKKRNKEIIMEEDKMTYERLINMENDIPEIIDYPSESNDSMLKFVTLSIVVMAIVFGSLLLFHLI